MQPSSLFSLSHPLSQSSATTDHVAPDSAFPCGTVCCPQALGFHSKFFFYYRLYLYPLTRNSSKTCCPKAYPQLVIITNGSDFSDKHFGILVYWTKPFGSNTAEFTFFIFSDKWNSKISHIQINNLFNRCSTVRKRKVCLIRPRLQTNSI